MEGAGDDDVHQKAIALRKGRRADTQRECSNTSFELASLIWCTFIALSGRSVCAKATPSLFEDPAAKLLIMTIHERINVQMLAFPLVLKSMSAPT